MNKSILQATHLNLRIAKRKFEEFKNWFETVEDHCNQVIETLNSINKSDLTDHDQHLLENSVSLLEDL